MNRTTLTEEDLKHLNMAVHLKYAQLILRKTQLGSQSKTRLYFWAKWRRAGPVCVHEFSLYCSYNVGIFTE